MKHSVLLLATAGGALALAQAAVAADYRSIGEPAAVLYHAPSPKGKPLFVLGRDTPLEVIVPVEGWSKVRDVGGTIGWVEKKSLAHKRTFVLRAPFAEG